VLAYVPEERIAEFVDLPVYGALEVVPLNGDGAAVRARLGRRP
jgi:hypothetical protein